MNEDQLIEAAEREMDLYRAEVARITAQRDEAREQLANVRSVCEGASAGNLANTPRGRLAKAVLSQMGPPA